MESFMTYYREVNSYLCETVLETDLPLDNIYSVFCAVVSQDVSYSRHGSFVCLKRNKVFLGTLPQITHKLERMLFDSGQSLSRTRLNSVMNMFREKRNIVIISLYGKSVLITRNDILSLLKLKLSRELKEGKLVKRYIDSDVLMALFIVNTFRTERNSPKDSSADERDEEMNDLCNVFYNKNLKAKQTGGKRMSTLSAVAPRHHHTTTLVDLEIVAFPNDNQKYNQPKYPDSRETEDKYPTQVTETDAGQPSFEPYPRPNTSSFGAGENYGLAQTNVYSAPSFSYNRRATENHNVIESGTGIPFHAKPAKYPDYMEKQKREKSFHTTKWPVDDKPDYFLLAEYGFFFTGNSDLVRCHHCGIGLKDWVKEDDVLNEHVKHSSACGFLIQKFGKVNIDQMKLALTAESNSDRDSTASDSSNLPYKIRSPRYQTMESRVASFAKFPRHINLLPQQLAVAGLFFTGNGDLCRCFTCDGGLKDWSSGDDPIKEHATYFPNCAYINQLKGPDYVKLQQQNRQRNEPVGAACGSSTITQPAQTSPDLPMNQLTIADISYEYSSFDVSQVVQQLGYAEIDVITAKAELQKKGNKLPTAEDIVNTLLDLQERTENFKTVTAPQEHENNVQALTEENKKLSRLIYCMLCFTGEADMLFLPCTHHRTCHECAADLIFCPVCNEFIKEKVKTFRS
ncbi:baculoviral IAP repeat-containing protein 3-like [Mercenaria mercenaria]|uniref:baculoviral IAP repeat-containing protein 3-like n=1 Tax=Mercenaria mercenaria TaxID=6596 RepID=UPI00234E3C90|nr:baculoviral IAP repeat-containing protein 3-like [Mercenaria mercenaria]